MRKLVLAGLLALLAGCSLLGGADVAEPTVPASERTLKVLRECEDPTENGNASGVDVGGGYVATAAHVVNAPEEAKCKFTVVSRDGVSEPAVPLAVHPETDAAVLRIATEREPICFRQASPDEHITAIGFPHQRYSVTQGVMLTEPNQHFMQFARVLIDPGSSGGGAWTDEGCLAGLTVGKFPDTPITVIVSSRALPALLP